MINPYFEKIDIKRILEVQNYQHQYSKYFEEDIPANSQVDGFVNITGYGHFMMLSMTGSYTTKTENEPFDDGICRLAVQLVDGSNQRELFDNFVPANLFLSPGRVQAIAGSGEPSQQLFLEYPFIYTFPLNSQIIVRVNNSGDRENNIRIMFKGINIFPSTRGNY